MCANPAVLCQEAKQRGYKAFFFLLRQGGMNKCDKEKQLKASVYSHTSHFHITEPALNIIWDKP